MRRTLVFLSIFVLTLVAVRGVSAAPQRKGSSTLSGVVLGPDDKPVAHASVSYQSHGLEWAFLDFEAESGQLRSTGVWKGRFFRVGKERQLEVRGEERTDVAFDLCKANPQGLRKEQLQTIKFFPAESAAALTFRVPASKASR
jgi:hypothetical protein